MCSLLVTNIQLEEREKESGLVVFHKLLAVEDQKEIWFYAVPSDTLLTRQASKA